MLLFVLLGAWRCVPVYEAFIEGARDGFEVAKACCLPGCHALRRRVLRAWVRWATRSTAFAGWWKAQLGHALCRCAADRAGQTPSGSAARAMLIETMQAKA